MQCEWGNIPIGLDQRERDSLWCSWDCELGIWELGIGNLGEK